MALTFSFRFLDDELNHKLVALLKKSHVKHKIDKDGVIYYSPEDEDAVGNDLIPSIRDRAFSPWQIISCPKNWADRYKLHMTRHGVPFVEELIDNQLCFLISRHHRPHSWQMDEEELAKAHPIRKGCDQATVKRLCQILIENRRGKTLGEEILRDLSIGYINYNTYRRLSRWCNPARQEPDARPIAEAISRQLFGRVISRMP